MAFSLLIMCEADKYQLTNKDFTNMVEDMYGPIAVVVNSCGSFAHSQFYPMFGQVMAFSPYYKGGRDRDTDDAAALCQKAWAQDKGSVFHCNQTFHRGPLACCATFMVAFNCVPQDRMLFF